MGFPLPDQYIPEGEWEGVQRNFDALSRLFVDGPWHEIGAAGEPAFAGTFINSGGVAETAAFRLASPKLVALKGTVRGSAVNSSQTVFTLPAAYSPAKERNLPAWIGDVGGAIYAAVLKVKPAGTVTLYSLALGTTAITDGGIEGTFAL